MGFWYATSADPGSRRLERDVGAQTLRDFLSTSDVRESRPTDVTQVWDSGSPGSRAQGSFCPISGWNPRVSGVDLSPTRDVRCPEVQPVPVSSAGA